jgi:small subunit ribosomal protein S16
MSVRVRLTRVGSKKNPIWRVVVADQRSPRDGRFIETVGQYNPQTDPSTIVLDEERLQHWIARGAQPTGTVRQLMRAYAKSPREAPATQATEPAAEAAGTATAPDAEPAMEAAPEPAGGEAQEAPGSAAAAAEAPEADVSAEPDAAPEADAAAEADAEGSAPAES